MSEKPQFKKKMPFAPVRTKHTETGRRMTERQKAAYKRQKDAYREAQKEGRIVKGKASHERLVKINPGKVRITSLIVGELTRALAVILKLDGPADQLMKAFFKSNPKLGSRDRSILAEAIFYALRHLASITYRMKPIAPARAPKVAALLTLISQYGKDAVPDSILGSDKGPLENMLSEPMGKAAPEVAAEMPFWLYDRIEKQYGPKESQEIFKASQEGAPLDLRVNILKAKREDVLKELEDHGVKGEETPFSPDGIRLVDKPGLMRWPMYQEGRIDVQDEGSQLVARLIGAKRGEMICDFCAGAGGKTLAIGSAMRSTGRLYAFDVNEKRLAGLTPRMRRAGLTNVHPMAIRNEKDLRVKRLRGKFDRVLVDAPCTGTGTLRRNPDLRWRLNVKELERINALQKSILEEAAKLVKAGGRLVYATCSLLEEENQAVVRDFLSRHPEFEALCATDVLAKQGIKLPTWIKDRFGNDLVMLPNLTDTDGFFGAVLQKKVPAKSPAPEKPSEG